MANLKKAFFSVDANSDHEKDLEEFFVVTEAIGRARSTKDHVCVLSGFKGIGKSATYRALTEFGPRPKTRQMLTPKRYRLYLPAMSLRSAACSHEFEYELAVELLRIFLESSEQLGSRPLRREARGHVDSFLKNLKKWGGKFGGISILGCGFNLHKADQPILSGLVERTEENAAIETLKRICDAGVKMRLVIDDPEDIFTASSQLDKSLLGGLWLAAARLNQENTNLKVILLLKRHVFDLVLKATPDLDKCSESYGHLAWNSSQLIEFICSRLKYYCGATDANWRQMLFGKKVAVNTERAFFDYLLPNVRNGPREVSRWLYLAAVEAKAKKKRGVDLPTIKAVHQKVARDAYRTFNATFGEEYDGIGDVVRRVFRENPSRTYHHGELEDRIADLIQSDREYQALMRLDWMQSQTSTSIPSLLFRSGAIAIHLDGQLILPYMEGYTVENFEDADAVSLVPLFQKAVIRRKHRKR